MSVAAAVRIRDRRVFASVTKLGRRSLRKIAQATGLSKSSVARSLEAMEKRNKYPESHLWETEEGQAWLRTLVLAAIYVFGIKGNQGADRMTEFFKRIRVNAHVGISPNALRSMMRRMEEEIAEFQRRQEAEQGQKGGKKRDIVAGGDETWLGDKMVLVLMDLVSGYLIVEEEAQDRSYATWEAKTQPRLKALGLQACHFISDRGKALVKLALSSLGCLSGADIFHAQRDISKWLGRAMHGKFGQASKQLREAEENRIALEKKGTKPEKMEEREQRVEQCEEKLETTERDRQAYNEAQLAVSAAVHAFSVQDNAPQSSEQVEKQMEEQAQCFEQIAEKQSVQDTKDAVGKFRRQIKDVASIVDAWWLWTKESLVEFEPGTDLGYWLLRVLLPVIYWHHQLRKTQNPDMKKLYQAAWQAAHAAYAVHPVTQTMSKEDLDRWRSWGEWASDNFHRASSAVEGRNGFLSQSYRDGRGLTNHRMGALTSVHNYDTRRRDGTTPAERLYGVQFPDLFDWLLGRMGALPLPRKARPRTVHNPLAADAVPP